MNSAFGSRDPAFGLSRTPSGVIVVDKPSNMSSAQVVARVKRHVNAQKVGHTGTLDPFACGVLICCVNNATRLARFFLHGDKKYEAVLKLGAETDTQDTTGRVVSVSRPVQTSAEEICSVFKQFEGTIEQSPPVYSALKHKGVPLYELARQGRPVQKPPRRVRIEYINILDIDLPLIRFEVSCSAGTYIRTLSADIGRVLGCGAYLKALTRIESSGFRIEEALSLTEIQKLSESGRIANRMIGMADALRGMPTIVADPSLIQKIRQGRTLSKDDVSFGRAAKRNERYVKVVDAENNLIAVLIDTKGSKTLTYCCVFNA